LVINHSPVVFCLAVPICRTNFPQQRPERPHIRIGQLRVVGSNDTLHHPAFVLYIDLVAIQKTGIASRPYPAQLLFPSIHPLVVVVV